VLRCDLAELYCKQSIGYEEESNVPVTVPGFMMIAVDGSAMPSSALTTILYNVSCIRQMNLSLETLSKGKKELEGLREIRATSLSRVVTSIRQVRRNIHKLPSRPYYTLQPLSQ
jgi:hypothetical protein